MKMVFVFGSNDAGIHGAGAAQFAYKEKGARYGKSYGHYGDSFAIPTKDENIESLPIERIAQYVQGFLAYAKGHRKVKFQVTRIGCGLAGFADADMAALFKGASLNVFFDEEWRQHLGNDHPYWGTFNN